ncbi:endonuclease/exonuclease/phosphatase family protein [Ignatzschineria cameli]|uniref:Endonuclease/exonuclease/phosphatase family protein n=1 Tax=Ignatzschineria cameli TaxID=2182793 RepID=A0A2U2AL53_9GAMM|nr:endonuclease/exonuclease/phosphatase family protein [Ignatzschineria cameli]PWD83809.1 endonuclease/exonuclease/phosphatase family protein [Ignatzschineria cameli]PWD86113.1 endonuclease/exonuclease/phosphatase family protein [Ignatzschineria cameli]PWD88380.1 endonuclease/exonuclease/phosphatase family protein [Ignatzschineria cameli]PWD88916.1 endonuclease/exonuclease/phosphatase family protein [Ignatzschineria cameli]PWD89633.1 endonuclease/exonuclease/phosphatase family protein [Ignatzs
MTINDYIMANHKNHLFRFTSNQNGKETLHGETRLDRFYPFSKDNRLTVMVWNIYKQQKLNWLPILTEYGKDRDLILLQEAKASEELIQFSKTHFLVGDQVPAIEITKDAYGVMTLASSYPLYSRPFRTTEPFLRLAKSALVTVYPLHDKRLLMVVNVHSVNFSLGVKIYREQIQSIAEHVINHNGPVIFAGDFNTWSRKRRHLLYLFTRRMGLKPVIFNDDYRKAFFNSPLDFVFYRGLRLEKSEVIKTDASDHNPLLVDFRLY